MKRNFKWILTAAFAFVLVFLYWVSGKEGVFSNAGFMPHGHCYLWSQSLVWTMVITDSLIGLAYISISLCLYTLVRKIQIPFGAIFLAFGLFIAACGGTHFMEVYTLWFPNYWLAAFVKVVTAVASVATAAIMFPLLPKVMGFATAAKLSEERKSQLELLNHELEIKTRALTIANQELEAFSYSVSHDLRAPLRGIDGFSKALVEDYGDSIPAEGKEYLHFIRGGSQRMGQIIDDLLKLAGIARVGLVKQDVDLSAMARDIVKTLSGKDSDRKTQVSIQDGLVASGDSGLLRIVLENLLSNAWKFSSKVPQSQIEMGSKLADGKNEFFVRDNGVGFDMKYAGKLFGAFQRLHAETEFVGTGIGLATAKRVIERHNGHVRAESAPGKGTTIFFTVGV